jgi:hypothetical protein
VSILKNNVTGDIIHIPDELDAMHTSRPEWSLYDPEAEAAAYPEVPAAVTAPAGATGEPVPEFDPEDPLMAGPAVAFERIEEIKGAALDSALKDLALDVKGSTEQKRDRLADRLTKEMNNG